MPRPKLPLGSWGAINASTASDGRVRAYTRYRYRDGRTRKVERTASTKTKATRALRSALTDMAASDNGDSLDTDSTIDQAARLWLSNMADEVAETTHVGYRRGVNNHISPDLGGLLIRETKTSRINTWLKQLKTSGISANYRRSLRTMLSGILQLAVLEDILDNNPVTNLPRITGGNTRSKRTFTTDELASFLSALDNDRHATRADLPAFLRFLFGTGVRYGEALAVRWQDINLGEHPITVGGVSIPEQSCWINGNLVEVEGRGVVRHHGKTAAANRIVGLPQFLVALLMVRREVDDHDDDPVFPNGIAAWRRPTNVQRAVRNFRNRAGFEGFTTHVPRRTVATLLDQAGQSPRDIADQVGHTDPSLTQRVYMGRGMANPDAAAALDDAYRDG